MGLVYRATDRKTGATVALKMLAPETGDKQRFAREAALLARIDHPGVVRYVDHGELAGGEQWLAMEWLEGEDLSDRLTSGGTLSIDETLRLARKVAAGLAAAHRAGIVHRDLKPANIFLVGGHLDAPKLLDFGVARTTASSDLTVTGTVLGTPAYMAPEQISDETISAAADVYGVGACLFCCLLGRAPFTGTHHLAVLAKVVVEPPPPLRDIRPDVPAAISDLVARLLAKEPSERPANGAALEAELAALADRTGPGLASERRMPAAISAREQRVACVVLCASGPTPDEATIAEGASGRTEDEMRSAIISRGGSLDRIGKGASLITIPHAASAAEQAARAARCALAVASVRTGAPIFVATGKVLVTGEGRVGEVIDRAAAALAARRHEPGVYVDGATAELIEGRFRMRPAEDEWRLLVEEEENALPVRMLLGRPAACIGRDTQIAMLDAMITASTDDARAGAALVVAEPGLGKTHLVNELLRPSRGRHEGLDVLVARGDPMRASSAFGMVAQLIARAAGIRDSDPVNVRAEKLAQLVEPDHLRELLGELSGVPTPPAQASAALRAARADAAVMADALRDAWLEWMRARTEQATLLLLLEDVHWADVVSLRLLETTAIELADRPLFILATARPEGSTAFAERFKARGLVEITLGPLGAGAAEKLVREALGARVTLDAEAVRALCKRAAGHPFLLEELVRAVADGRGADVLPSSVLGMMQTRLDDLGAGARQVLRAGSVFGESFSKEGVRRLLGDETTANEVRAAIGELSAQEMIGEERTKQAEGQYRFRHALLRDAAYATLSDVDRVRAHQRAAEWLEQAGELDPAVVAEHYDRGADRPRAAHFFRRAAEQAMAKTDFDRALAFTQRALSLGPDDATEAALRGIEAEVLYWRGDIKTAADRAPSAVARLDRGTRAWLDAVSVAVGALGQLGRNEEVAALLLDAARIRSAPADRDAHIVALCRGATQLYWAHARTDLASIRSALHELAPDANALDAYAAGWLHRVHAEAAWLHDRDMARCMAELDASCGAFERARAQRPLALSKLNAASLVGWSGNPARGVDLVHSACADASRLGAGFLLKYGRAVEGLVSTYARAPDAADIMARALEDVAGSPRLAFICRIVLGWHALDAKDHAEAAKQADAANAIAVVDDLRCAGLALRSRAALARGDQEAALEDAQAAMRVATNCTDLELTFGLPRLALAEAQLARGDRVAAKEALDPALRALDRIAATIPNEDERRAFLDRPMANDQIMKLAHELT
jgi:eukaryotic-like serine/threonine-protein kinase